MRMFSFAALTLLAMCTALSAQAAAAATAAAAAPAASASTMPVSATSTTPLAASKIVLVGDSTTAVQGGWGPSFCAQHVTSFLSCLNLARGGRSTSNYRAEGSWEIALKELRSGGYRQVVVLIQFGHNDQPGKPGRSTDLTTEFPANLRRYVNEARAAGALPVLVTPLTRRQFERGQLIDDLAPWAAATRAVARELQVPLIDLHARSRALVQGMGPVLAMRLAQQPAEPAQLVAAQSGTTIGKTPAQTVAPSSAPASVAKTTTAVATAQDNASAEPMGQAKLAFDYTHLGADGADLFAAIVADELAQHVPALRPLLIP
ncbi:rhamnogalacturonan acetylesterase [Xanthomonas campestris]|uniref:rhamnogalacturonan acetylesterase n=3 Tax=Xanthomonas campestris TaxID=339 RepID=UPI000ABBB515|nr:rhamnogalacturonan acetylesterase [Xanthomonas campestris]MCC5053340.1 rhamnogalacturonan acetylesterase [Xanthomonas campestris pv. aberrans]MEA9837464.1 rhamnogalacturonan acetylesterase [Xanthomonas campestris pv. raphani]MDM7680438.1 rhamnogalacturonan acetylesterase [Xanthomonas campestris pv. campestris]MDM7681770.1 rhamnogalacturonan acetylesterase [Xanthomonas campestris pv. campestris]MDM7688793.1 rhamnogalacturonan acetylesterase [Xanthomonas campestris pv. campestris]